MSKLSWAKSANQFATVVAAAGLMLLSASGASAQQPAAPRSPGQPAKPTPPPGGGGAPVNPLIKRPGEKTGDQLVHVQAMADVARIKPNSKFHLAFVFDIEPQWHIYWENAGISGAPTEIAVTAPPGFVVGKTLFPRPQIISTPEGACYGYEERAVLLVELTSPESALPQLNFSADVSWLVCKDICKMGSAKTTLSLAFGETSLPGVQPVEIDPVVDKAKTRLPKPLTSVSGASVEFDGQVMTLIVPADARNVAEFFPNPSPGVEFGEAKVEQHADRLHMMVPVTLKPNNAMGKPMRLAGVLGLGRGLDDPCFTFDVPLTDDGRPRRN